MQTNEETEKQILSIYISLFQFQVTGIYSSMACWYTCQGQRYSLRLRFILVQKVKMSSGLLVSTVKSCLLEKEVAQEKQKKKED